MKTPVVPITVVVVIVVGFAAYYLSQGGVTVPTLTKTISGLEISEFALNLGNDLKTPAGGYEDYVRYESGNVIRSSEDSERAPEDIGVKAYFDRDLYLVYSTLADATDDVAYATIANVKFNEFYSECQNNNLCNGDMYGAVYNEWKRTGNEELKNALDSAESSLIARAEEDTNQTAFSFGESLRTSLSADDCAVGDIALEIRNAGIQEDNLQELESFATALQTGGSLDSEEALSNLASCGNFIYNLYDVTQNGAYKNSAEKILQLIWSKHPSLKEFEESATNNLHVTEDVLAAALLAAKLHDSRIEVT